MKQRGLSSDAPFGLVQVLEIPTGLSRLPVRAVLKYGPTIVRTVEAFRLPTGHRFGPLNIAVRFYGCTLVGDAPFSWRSPLRTRQTKGRPFRPSTQESGIAHSLLF